MTCFQRNLIAAAVLFLTCLGPATARNLPDPKSGCKLEVPDDWVNIGLGVQSGYAVLARNPAKTKSIELYIQPVSPTATVDHESPITKGFEQGYIQSGGTVVKSEYKKLHGINFFVLTGTKKAENSTVTAMAYVCVVNSHMYQVCTYFKDGDPATDPSLAAAVDSFTILP